MFIKIEANDREYIINTERINYIGNTVDSNTEGYITFIKLIDGPEFYTMYSLDDLMIKIS